MVERAALNLYDQIGRSPTSGWDRPGFQLGRQSTAAGVGRRNGSGGWRLVEGDRNWLAAHPPAAGRQGTGTAADGSALKGSTARGASAKASSAAWPSGTPERPSKRLQAPRDLPGIVEDNGLPAWSGDRSQG
jgi:hypothetical protein